MLYLAVGVVDLEGHPLPVQLDLLGVDQLGTVLILTDEPSTWECDQVKTEPSANKSQNS